MENNFAFIIQTIQFGSYTFMALFSTQSEMAMKIYFSNIQRMTIFTRSQYVGDRSSLPPIVNEVNGLCIKQVLLSMQRLNPPIMFTRTHTFLGIKLLVDLYSYIHNYHNLYCDNDKEYKTVKFRTIHQIMINGTHLIIKYYGKTLVLYVCALFFAHLVIMRMYTINQMH